MATIMGKLAYSIMTVGLMIALANQTTYGFVDKLVGNKGIIALNGCPTVKGHLVHTVIFFILLFALMISFNLSKSEQYQRSTWLLAKYSFYGTMLFFIITSTELYKLIGNLTNGATADLNGCPTSSGLLLHSLIYLLMIFGVMFFPKDC